MKILITGNMGYIGPVVVKRLRQSYPDATICGFDMGYFATCLTNTVIFPECAIDIQYYGDIRDVNIDFFNFNEIDVVVHLAAISNDPMGNRFDLVTKNVNYSASVKLARYAKMAGCKAFVFASSCSVYGDADDHQARTESSLLNPLTIYARSKIATENSLQELADKSFKVTCLRFATACGMSDRLRLDLVLNDFVASAVVNKKITILSDGTPWRPLIDVHDMARAIDWAIARDINDGGEFLAINTGSNANNYQVKELAEIVADVITGVEIEINKDAAPDKRSYQVNFDLFKKLAPDYQPQINLKSTIETLADALKQMKFSDSAFRDSNLIRLKVLNNLIKRRLLDNDLRWIFKKSSSRIKRVEWAGWAGGNA